MSKNIRTQIGKVIGKTLNSYHARVKPVIDDIKFKEQYQGRIIDCMVGEVDDNYIETPETDAPIVKLEHSKEGLVKVPSIKGKTILVDSDGNETDTPAEGCKLVSVGEDEDNKLIILSKNSDSSLHHKTEILLNEPLRKLNNRVYDEVVNNKIIRRVGSFVANGNLNWQIHPHIKDGYLNVWVDPFKYLTNAKLFSSTECVNFIKSNNFKVENIREEKKELISIHYRETVKWCFISIDKTKASNLEDAKKYISNNPITILYELEEPIIEELPNGVTLQGFDDTTMYIENSITPTVSYGYNALIPYKEELSKQKEEVETNTLDIENNIIPYLMDMEFNLMLMEDN